MALENEKGWNLPYFALGFFVVFIRFFTLQSSAYIYRFTPSEQKDTMVIKHLLSCKGEYNAQQFLFNHSDKMYSLLEILNSIMMTTTVTE